MQPTGPFYATLRQKKDFDVSIDFNCQAVVNPLWTSGQVHLRQDRSGNSYGGYDTDPEVDKMFDAMNRRAIRPSSAS